jgi:uncharacterized protein YbjT (DUF2867 family)
VYLVAGASSEVGRRVVEGLVARKAAVRVLVRGDADAARFRTLGVEVVRGDVRDAQALAGACRGARTVISLVGRHFARTEAGLWDVDAAGNCNLIRAAAEAGADHFVLVSVLWADRDLPPVIFRAKRQAEEALLGSGLTYTILRPATFVTGPNSLIGVVGPTVERWGVAVVPAPDSRPISFIAAGDVADAVLAAALDGRGRNRVYDLGGPERLTLAEGARRVGKALRKPVRIVRLPRLGIWALGPLAKLRGFGPYEAVLMLDMMAEHGYDCDPAPARELLGRELTPVDSAIREYYAGRQSTAWRDSLVGTLVLRTT